MTLESSFNRCRKCEALYMKPWNLPALPTPRDPGICPACRDLERPGELRHEHFLRCPACKHTWRPDFETDVWQEDGGDIYCPECDHEFHVSTWITYTFTSPPLLEQKG